MSNDETYNYRWGQVVVERVASYTSRARDKGSTKVLRVKTSSSTVNIYISPQGQSIRVFKNGRELT